MGGLQKYVLKIADIFVVLSVSYCVVFKLPVSHCVV